MNQCNRREFMHTSLLGIMSFAFMAEMGCRTKYSQSPNVLLVITDDQGYGDVHCLGNKIIKTPVLDELYERSIRLTNFHVSPTCAPTRASLMTGRYCNATGVWHTIMGRSLLHPEEVTLADCFKLSGYQTGIFGKWHLGDNYPCRPQDHGFDEVLIHGGGGVWQTPDYFGNDYYDDTYFHNGVPEKYNGYCTDVWFENALRFMKDARNKRQPFFCYLTTNAPHSPYWVEDEYAEAYRKDDRVPNPEFYGMITNIDKNMGRLLKFLQETRLEENTLLIFMTDNGSAVGIRDNKGFNAGMRGRKGSEYEGGHRVPCFVYWPVGNIVGPRDIDQLSAHIDWLPTLVDLCGLTKPAGSKVHGTSLKPLLLGEDKDWPSRTIVVDSQRLENLVKWRKCSVMTQRWRLVNGEELYDIEKDPGQTKDISSQHPQVVEKLRTEYDLWWQEVSQRSDDYVRIVLGHEAENPTRLTCHDWHSEGATKTWNQDGIRNAPMVNGFWTVEIHRNGTYNFELRRWPRELDKAIQEGIPAQKVDLGSDSLSPGKALPIREARLKVADVDVKKTVSSDTKGVSFKVELKKCLTTMQTWFTVEGGASLGAYYVYVERI